MSTGRIGITGMFTSFQMKCFPHHNEQLYMGTNHKL